MKRAGSLGVAVIGMAVSAAVLPQVGGCASSPPRDNSVVGFGVVPTNTRIVAGDTVTISTHTENVAGRNPRIQWDASGNSKQENLDNGRAVRVRYDKPGTYVVTSRMTLDDGSNWTDAVTIRVDPVP